MQGLKAFVRLWTVDGREVHKRLHAILHHGVEKVGNPAFDGLLENKKNRDDNQRYQYTLNNNFLFHKNPPIIFNFTKIILNEL